MGDFLVVLSWVPERNFHFFLLALALDRRERLSLLLVWTRCGSS